MAATRQVGDAERRARLVARHRLDGTAGSVEEAVRGVVALHASDPVTPPLACRARVARSAGFAVADYEGAMYETRTLWRRHALRRTLFVTAADEAAVFDAAVGRDLAVTERRRLEGWLADELGGAAVAAWLAAAEADLFAVLADGAEWRTAELTRAVPALATEVTLGSGRWATRAPVSSRLLLVLAMEGRIVRTRPAGSWRSSQYRWAATEHWFAAIPPPIAPAAGRAELARRYLATHGPATLADLRWWTGWTAAQATAALRAVDAVLVDLDGGAQGHVLADDVDPPGQDPAAPSVALLPGLDPAAMGHTDRGWYLGAHRDRLFDRNGNAGPTVWVDGRTVGGWAQRPDGEVVVGLLDDVGAEAAAAVDREAAALTAWLDGVVVAARFPSPLQRELAR